MQIDTIYFLLGMLATIYILYYFSPEPEVLIKYPDISQDVSDVYIDDQDVCYRYHREEVE